MAIALALLSALAYGTSDFLAGLAGRRWAAEPVAGTIILVELVGATIAVAFVGGVGPRPGAIAWGAASGIGSAVGTLALYRGLAQGAMTAVAAVSAVLAAIGPVLVGLALGQPLHPATAVGIVVALPAIGLVCASPGSTAAEGPATAASTSTSRRPIGYGLLAGAGFGLLFVALARAGTRSGAWPVLSGQALALLLIGPLAALRARRLARPGLGEGLLSVGAGGLASAAALLFLAATGHGELAIVAVLGALYPAFTVLLARWLLTERWSSTQLAGLTCAALAVVLVSLG